MNKLFISPAAEKDLLEIKQYISEELDNPTSAVKVISQITNRIKDLVNFPGAGIPLSTKHKARYKYQ
jgi:toxin ParE1/3/4